MVYCDFFETGMTCAQEDQTVTDQVANPGPGHVSADSGVPHTARIWNYLLGGKDHYPIDREAGEKVLALMPDLADAARADRDFLVRVVRHLAGEVGIRQFLDIGTGLPTANNTHDVAQATAPECRIVYVDNDPLIMTYARALLSSTPQGRTDYIHADLRDPDTILREATRTLDFDRPIAVMLLSVLNHLLDSDEPYAIVKRILDVLPPGSHLAITHPVTDVRGNVVDEIVRFWNESGGTPPLQARSCAELARFFDGLELLEPGIVSSSHWRPAPCELGVPTEVVEFCGVGRKP